MLLFETCVLDRMLLKDLSSNCSKTSNNSRFAYLYSQLFINSTQLKTSVLLRAELCFCEPFIINKRCLHKKAGETHSFNANKKNASSMSAQMSVESLHFKLQSELHFEREHCTALQQALIEPLAHSDAACNCFAFVVVFQG